MFEELRFETRCLKVRNEILRRLAVRQVRMAVGNDVVEPLQRRSIRAEQDREFRSLAIQIHELAAIDAVGIEKLFERHRGD